MVQALSSKWKWAGFFILLFWNLPSIAQQARLDIPASLLEVGEPFRLAVACDNFVPDAPPVFPEIPGLAIRFAVKTERPSWINGVISTHYLFNYQVVANRAGTFNIPALSVKSAGKEYKTQPGMLQTIAGGVYAWISLIPSRTNPIVGEVITFDLNIYLDGSTRSLQNFQLSPPSGDGLSVSPFVSSEQVNLQTNGTTIILFPFKFTAAPAKTGLLRLETNVLSMDLGFPPLDIFQHPTKWRHVELTLPTVNISSHPLPDPGNKSFSGAIGKFQVKSSAVPLEVNANDPITLTVEVKGTGNIENLQVPQIEWPQFQVYPPRSQFVSTDPLKISGFQRIEVIVSPQSTNVTSIPAFSLTYFDPELNKYQTTSTDPIPLRVKQGKAGPMIATNLSIAGPPPVKSLPSLIYERENSSPHFFQPTFAYVLGLNGVPAFILAIFSFVFYRRSQRKVNEREQHIGQLLAKIKSAHQTLLQPGVLSTEQFYGEIFRLLQSGLSLVSGKSELAITEETLEELANSNWINTDSRALAEELFLLCNQLRYGGTEAISRTEILLKVSKLVEEFLQKEPK
ncbi:MAG: hypothetical protein JWN25_327 [Verrucomicrobiales bacterium]|nr:hypothetical protein [Verrucomicrobiales bacterium]